MLALTTFPRVFRPSHIAIGSHRRTPRESGGHLLVCQTGRFAAPLHSRQQMAQTRSGFGKNQGNTSRWHHHFWRAIFQPPASRRGGGARVRHPDLRDDYGSWAAMRVRGKHADLNNPTLRSARHDGMMLFPVSKQEYDACKHRGEELIGPEFPQYYILPEGGATDLAVESCTAIAREIAVQLHQHNPHLQPPTPLYICAPAGTGSTAAGLVDGLKFKTGKVLVFPVVNKDFDSKTILKLLAEARLRSLAEMAELERRLSIIRDYEFGGFAKKHPPVLDFVRIFEAQTGILLDPIYTAKMMFGIFDMLAKGDFPPGSTVVAVHTGGLQGWEGFRERYGA